MVTGMAENQKVTACWNNTTVCRGDVRQWKFRTSAAQEEDRGVAALADREWQV